MRRGLRRCSAVTVVHLVPAMEQGGVESVVCSLNRVVTGAGWRSVVISNGGRLAERIAADGGRHVAIDLKSKNPLTYFPRALKLRRALRALAAEDGEIVVCAHSRVPAWLFVWANRALGLRWITYAHGANSVSRYSAVMTRGDVVVAPSRFIAGFLLDNYGAQGGREAAKCGGALADRICVISPCVDLERFDPARLDRAFVEAKRREWGIEPGMAVTMSVGRISPVKGFANVLRDFARPSRSPEAAGDGGAGGQRKLVVVGGADRRHEGHLEELKALARELGIEGRVVFAGAQAKMPECISLADEVVVGNTEKPESFGLSVVEALAMGKPVRLLREFGGAAEIIAAVEGRMAEAAGGETRNGPRGETCCSALAVAHGGAARREAVRALYGFEAMAAKSIELYSRLVENGKRTTASGAKDGEVLV